jgi:hypothetical protein
MYGAIHSLFSNCLANGLRSGQAIPRAAGSTSDTAASAGVRVTARRYPLPETAPVNWCKFPNFLVQTNQLEMPNISFIPEKSVYPLALALQVHGGTHSAVPGAHQGLTPRIHG